VPDHWVTTGGDDSKGDEFEFTITTLSRTSQENGEGCSVEQVRSILQQLEKNHGKENLEKIGRWLHGIRRGNDEMPAQREILHWRTAAMIKFPLTKITRH